MKSFRFATACLCTCILFCLPPAFLHAQDAPREVVRTDRFVSSDPGVQLFVREIRTQGETRGRPMLLLHGGGGGGIASFDLNLSGGSLAESFARYGFDVFVMDVRGWGRSSRPEALSEPADANPPAVPSTVAARDVKAVVDWIVNERNAPVTLVGWATGGHWAATYVATYDIRPTQVANLVLLNSLYGVDAPWDLGALFENPDRPGTFDLSDAAYRTATGEALVRKWTQTIPAEDPATWRDPRIAEAYAQTTLDLDPTSDERSPQSVRIPGAYRLESYNLARGVRMWEPEAVRIPTLVVRGALDFWSRPADLVALAQDLVRAPRVDTLTIPDGTHYLFMDRPERGRDAFLKAVVEFANAAP